MRHERLPQQRRGNRVDRREASRHIVALRLVQLQTGKMGRHEAHISEIAVYGCRLYTPASLLPGDRIMFSLDNIVMTGATIIWREGQCYGCRFDLPIDIDLLKKMAFDLA
ncbi:hypothetical protein ACFOWX_11090 [Sphingorhabdus arenilitoris]|uniref:PilZ domain-containing protein n=1 Tax=Sphingorhabdus arenilitoris TaxID=1490041 RepID=A0ABV8RI69_9SPHN